MVSLGQFDTAYHEHYSYLSLGTIGRIFTANGLDIFDVATIPTHGGSLRLFAQRRRAVTGAIFKRAVERNEIVAGRDPNHLAELFTSGFFFRFLMTRAPIDDAFIDAQIEAVIALASHPAN